MPKRKTKQGEDLPSRSDAAVASQGTTLSTLDGVFLFTFSIIVFLFALLNISIGTMGGLLSLLIAAVVSHPFCIGVYNGIIKDDASERLAAWRLLLLFWAW